MRDTDHELAAINGYAAISGHPAHRFRVVHRPKVETWYDFFDPETGKYGQCMLRSDGRWHQEPLGRQPVIIRFLSRKILSPGEEIEAEKLYAELQEDIANGDFPWGEHTGDGK